MSRIAFPAGRRTLAIATAITAAVFVSACSDVTAPETPVTGSLSAEALLASSGRNHSRKACRTEVTFMKWYTSSPFMTGFTCYGSGTYAGEILSRVDDGVFTQLKARYEVTDPRGRYSFKTVIQGTLTNQTGQAQLTGVITEGWRTGATVHVSFQRITPCALAVGPSVPNVCFQGTISVQSGRRDKGDKGHNDNDNDD